MSAADIPDLEPGQPDDATTARTIDEMATHCFACSPINPIGLQLVFKFDNEAITASATVHLTRNYEGAAGFIHGGILATLIDEAMSKLSRPLNALAMTRHLEIDYLRPAPIGETLMLTSRHIRRDGRKLFHEAELRNAAGDLLTRGKGLFIVLDEATLRAHGVTKQTDD